MPGIGAVFAFVIAVDVRAGEEELASRPCPF